MLKVTLKQLVKQGFGFELDLKSGDRTEAIFRNQRDGNLYRIYLASPRMYTGSWLVAERMFYANGATKKIPESLMKDYVVVGYR
jgi:hypothetical protein